MYTFNIINPHTGGEMEAFFYEASYSPQYTTTLYNQVCLVVRSPGSYETHTEFFYGNYSVVDVTEEGVTLHRNYGRRGWGEPHLPINEPLSAQEARSLLRGNTIERYCHRYLEPMELRAITQEEGITRSLTWARERKEAIELFEREISPEFFDTTGEALSMARAAVHHEEAHSTNGFILHFGPAEEAEVQMALEYIEAHGFVHIHNPRVPRKMGVNSFVCFRREYIEGRFVEGFPSVPLEYMTGEVNFGNRNLHGEPAGFWRNGPTTWLYYQWERRIDLEFQVWSAMRRIEPSN